MASTIAWTALDVLSSMPVRPLHMRRQNGRANIYAERETSTDADPDREFTPSPTG
jgi:hypothetical protein